MMIQSNDSKGFYVVQSTFHAAGMNATACVRFISLRPTAAPGPAAGVVAWPATDGHDAKLRWANTTTRTASA
jgi:hypothetical protein